MPIFYAFGLQSMHYKSLLQNYTHDRERPDFSISFCPFWRFSSAMIHKRMIVIVSTVNKQADWSCRVNKLVPINPKTAQV